MNAFLQKPSAWIINYVNHAVNLFIHLFVDSLVSATRFTLP